MSDIHGNPPYTRFEDNCVAGYKAGGGPQEYLAQMVIDIRKQSAALRRLVTFQHSYHEDNLHPPRDFNHVRAVIGDLITDWESYGEQEQHDVSEGVKRDAEERVFQQVVDDLHKIGRVYAAVKVSE